MNFVLCPIVWSAIKVWPPAPFANLHLFPIQMVPNAYVQKEWLRMVMQEDAATAWLMTAKNAQIQFQTPAKHAITHSS